MEATHRVGAPGEPPFLGGSKNVPPEGGLSFESAGFYKDHNGIVHLTGLIEAGGGPPAPGVLYQLPPGFRPAPGRTLLFVAAGDPVLVFGSGVSDEGVDLGGVVYAPTSPGAFTDGISFRAES
jgi:hypothetical protein